MRSIGAYLLKVVCVAFCPLKENLPVHAESRLERPGHADLDRGLAAVERSGPQFGDSGFGSGRVDDLFAVRREVEIDNGNYWKYRLNLAGDDGLSP